MWRRYGMGSNREKAEQYMEKKELCNLFKTRVIEAAESHDVIQRNNDLTKRVKEDRYQEH